MDGECGLCGGGHVVCCWYDLSTGFNLHYRTSHVFNTFLSSYEDNICQSVAPFFVADRPVGRWLILWSEVVYLCCARLPLGLFVATVAWSAQSWAKYALFFFLTITRVYHWPRWRRISHDDWRQQSFQFV